MKTTLIALSAAATMSLGSFAIADEIQSPALLTDTEMDTIVGAGQGYIYPGNRQYDYLFETYGDSYQVVAGKAYLTIQVDNSKGPCQGVYNGGLNTTGFAC